jgi:hypothetical protein
MVGGALGERRNGCARRSGVQFRMIVHSDDTIECRRQPELAPWELPGRDPAEPRPSAPELKAQRRDRQRRWRERHRVRKAAHPAPEPLLPHQV